MLAEAVVESWKPARSRTEDTGSVGTATGGVGTVGTGTVNTGNEMTMFPY